MFDEALKLNVNIAGFSYHVGSQLNDLEPFITAATKTLKLMERMETKYGITFKYLDFGGGFPVPYLEPVITVNTIAEQLNTIFTPYLNRYTFIGEPGRSVVGESMTVFSTVVNITKRGKTRWVFMDEGIYGSYSNIPSEHVHPLIIPVNNQSVEERKPTVLSGPTCDSVDIIEADIPLLKLHIGDVLVSPNMGAYTTVTSSLFNNLPIAPIFVLK